MSTLKIKGVKFFQDHLNALKIEHAVSPLPASAIAAYILTHLNCDDIGILRARDPQNALKKWSNDTGIPYSTLHTGREILVKRHLISESLIGNDPIYEINGYAVHNQSNRFVDKLSLSYFRIPFALKNSTTLKKLVSSKDSIGLLMLLDLCNSFHRDARWHKEAFDISRTMSFFKEKMGKSAKKIRDWMEAVQEIFNFSPLDYQERVPNPERVAIRKKKNPIQIVVKKYTVGMVKGLLSIEEDPFATKSLEATLRKDAIFHFKRNQMVVSKKEIKDMMTGFRQEVLLPFSKYIAPSDTKRNPWFYNIFFNSLEDTIDYHQQGKKEDSTFRIRNMGGFFRSKVKHYTCEAMLQDLSKEETILEAYKNVDSGIVDLEELRELWRKAEEHQLNKH